MHPVVKAKLSSSQSESDNCIYHLKLYRRYDNGRTQLVMHNQASGHVKFTVMITSMYGLEYTIVRRKMMKEVGVISFISMVRAEVIEQFMLRVNRNAVHELYWKLVELGASEKNTA
jgi:VIT1/CCC1 family predicted Fe2+/Mn2+ transporter